MYLHTGWKKFTCVHDVQVGYLVNFFYEDDCEMSVNEFNNESCRIHYHGDDSSDNIDDDGSEEDKGQHDL
jgi:hypothetical protein